MPAFVRKKESIVFFNKIASKTMMQPATSFISALDFQY